MCLFMCGKSMCAHGGFSTFVIEIIRYSGAYILYVSVIHLKFHVFYAHAAQTRICMCEVCVHRVRYYICLELLTPTDSERLPLGQSRENRKRTSAVNSGTEQEQEEKTERQTGKALRRVDELSDQLYWVCSITMWAGNVKRGRLVSDITQACQISCANATLSENSLSSSLISNICRHGHRSAVMNDRDKIKMHTAHAPGQPGY